jgi:hypothetical protein
MCMCQPKPIVEDALVTLAPCIVVLGLLTPVAAVEEGRPSYALLTAASFGIINFDLL